MALPPSPFYFRKLHVSRVKNCDTILADKSHKYGCLIGILPLDVMRKITSWAKENIPDEHQAEEGIEFRSHLTIKYGFKDSGFGVLRDLRFLLSRQDPIKITLGKLSLFEGNEDGDVLKIEIKGEGLHVLNKEISSKFNCEDKYPTYIPHVTVAYLKPEFSKLYKGADYGCEGRDIELSHLEYSSPFGQRENIILSYPTLTMGEKSMGVQCTESEAHADNKGHGKFVGSCGHVAYQCRCATSVSRFHKTYYLTDKKCSDCEKRDKTLSSLNATSGGTLVPPPAMGTRLKRRKILLPRIKAHRPGEVWKGQSGRYFTMTQGRKVVPAKAPGQQDPTQRQQGVNPEDPTGQQGGMPQQQDPSKQKVKDYVLGLAKKGGKRAGEMLRKLKVSSMATLSPNARKNLKTVAKYMAAVEHKLQTFTHAAQKLAVQTATERGLSPEQVERVARATKIVDMALQWTVNIPAVGLALDAAAVATGGTAMVLSKVGGVMPVASLAYLAVSTARDPLATLRAADTLIKQRSQGTVKEELHKSLSDEQEPQDQTEQVNQDQIVLLSDLMKRSQDPDRLEALVCAGIDQTGDFNKTLDLVQEIDGKPDEVQEEEEPKAKLPKIPPSPFAERKAIFAYLKKGSYFETCERDKQGHCLPKGEAGASKTEESSSPDAPKKGKKKSGYSKATPEQANEVYESLKGLKDKKPSADQVKEISEKIGGLQIGQIQEIKNKLGLKLNYQALGSKTALAQKIAETFLGGGTASADPVKEDSKPTDSTPPVVDSTPPKEEDTPKGKKKSGYSKATPEQAEKVFQSMASLKDKKPTVDQVKDIASKLEGLQLGQLQDINKKLKLKINYQALGSKTALADKIAKLYLGEGEAATPPVADTPPVKDPISPKKLFPSVEDAKQAMDQINGDPDKIKQFQNDLMNSSLIIVGDLGEELKIPNLENMGKKQTVDAIIEMLTKKTGTPKEDKTPTPPEPGFTGVDSLGRKWINGKLVPAELDASEEDLKKAAEAIKVIDGTPYLWDVIAKGRDIDTSGMTEEEKKDKISNYILKTIVGDNKPTPVTDETPPTPTDPVADPTDENFSGVKKESDGNYEYYFNGKPLPEPEIPALYQNKEEFLNDYAYALEGKATAAFLADVVGGLGNSSNAALKEIAEYLEIPTDGKYSHQWIHDIYNQIISEIKEGAKKEETTKPADPAKKDEGYSGVKDGKYYFQGKEIESAPYSTGFLGTVSILDYPGLIKNKLANGNEEGVMKALSKLVGKLQATKVNTLYDILQTQTVDNDTIAGKSAIELREMIFNNVLKDVLGTGLGVPTGKPAVEDGPVKDEGYSGVKDGKYFFNGKPLPPPDEGIVGAYYSSYKEFKDDFYPKLKNGTAQDLADMVELLNHTGYYKLKDIAQLVMANDSEDAGQLVENIYNQVMSLMETNGNPNLGVSTGKPAAGDEPVATDNTPKPPEPGFTGIDSLGRAWINGKLVPAEFDPASEEDLTTAFGNAKLMTKLAADPKAAEAKKEIGKNMGVDPNLPPKEFGHAVALALLKEKLTKEGKIKPADSPPVKTPSVEKLEPINQDKSDFPVSTSELQFVKNMEKGSTGAKLYQDSKGNKYIWKDTSTGKIKPDHLKSEASCDAAYAALGIAASNSKMYDTPNGPVKIAKFEQGQDLQSFMAKATPEQMEKVKQELRKGFVADCLLSNWDVMGKDFDNIFVTPDGKVIRIDNGGGLKYRATGGFKPGTWGPTVNEIDSMRSHSTNPKAAKFFSGISDEEIWSQIQQISNNKDSLLKSLSPDDAAIVGKRLQWLQEKYGPEDPNKPNKIEGSVYADKSNDWPTSLTNIEASPYVPKPEEKDNYLFKWPGDSMDKRPYKQDKDLPPSFKKHNEKILKNLPPDCQAHIKEYTSNKAYSLNDYMRKCPETLDCLSKEDRKMVKDCEDGLALAGKLAQPISVWRNMGLSPDALKKFTKACQRAMKEGTDIRMPGFKSASINPHATIGSGNVKFEIKAKTGIYVNNVSHYKTAGEFEFLQGHNVRYKVVGIKTGIPGWEGKTVFQLEEI